MWQIIGASIWTQLEHSLKMSRQSHFIVQSFDPAKGDQLRAGAPVVCRTKESARRTAEGLP